MARGLGSAAAAHTQVGVWRPAPVQTAHPAVHTQKLAARGAGSPAAHRRQVAQEEDSLTAARICLLEAHTPLAGLAEDSSAVARRAAHTQHVAARRAARRGPSAAHMQRVARRPVAHTDHVAQEGAPFC